MLRGALLLAIAVILGVALLNTFDDGKDPFAQSLLAAGGKVTTTTTAAPPEVTTTTTVAAPAFRTRGRREGASRQRHRCQQVRRQGG